MGTAYLPSPLHKFAYGFFALLMPRSEAMYFLDISPEVAVKRINENRRVVEMFEDINSLRRVRSKALFLASLGRWHIVNGDRDPTEIEAEIVKSI
jgi:dTMP kinase